MTASRLRTFVFLAGALIVGAIARAQQPSQAPKSAAQATSPSASMTPQPDRKPADGKAAQEPSAKAPAAKKAADPDATLIRDARNAGFKPQTIRGNLMFCRTAKELGSNFPVRTCYDETQVKIKIHEYQTQRNQLEQMHSAGFGSN